jgi:hypothetical protein
MGPYFDLVGFAAGLWTLRQSRQKNPPMNKPLLYGAMALLLLGPIPLLAFLVAQTQFGLFPGKGALGFGILYFMSSLVGNITIAIIATRFALRP